MKRWLVPGAVAGAVLLLLGGLWWVFGGGSSGDSEAGPSAVSSAGAPKGGGSGSEPGSPGTVEPSVPQAPSEPVPTKTNPDGVMINSYYRYDARHLAINYTTGVPECYGTVGEPSVEETPDAVIVTLTSIPPKNSGDIACIEIALMESVDITLSSPLGDREVLDGSFDRSVVPPGAAPDSGQDK
jgi:hypothetical protein